MHRVKNVYFLFLKTIIKFTNHTNSNGKCQTSLPENSSNWAQKQVFSHAYIVNGFKKYNELLK